jgi:hypothetical protein
LSGFWIRELTGGSLQRFIIGSEVTLVDKDALLLPEAGTWGSQQAFSDFEFLLNFLSLSKQNIPIIQTLLGGASEKTRDNIFINTFVELEPLIYLASIYQRANNFASLDEVLSSKKAVVILGTSQGNLALTKPINRVIMTRFFQRFQDKKTDRVGNRIRFEIDELQKQGKIVEYCRDCVLIGWSNTANQNIKI